MCGNRTSTKRQWRCVCACPTSSRNAGAARAHLWDDDGRSADLARLVDGAGRDAGRHGEHGVYRKPIYDVLEEAMNLSAGQRRAHAQRPRAEDRRAGLCLDCAIAGARAAAGQLRAARADPGVRRDLTRYRKVLIQERVLCRRSGCTRSWKMPA